MLFEMSEQIKSLQPYIIQNNDIYEGKRQLDLNMDLYYEGLELDTPEQKFQRWYRTPKYLYYPKIISSFNSSIYKKPPQYVTDLTEEQIENVDLLGNSLDEYSAQIPEQVLKQGFCATIVDYSNSLDRPYFTFIRPEQFVTFRTENTKGYPELAMFIYSVNEEVPDPVNEFKNKIQKVHYVWDLFGGQVRVRKYIRVTVEPEQTIIQQSRDYEQYSDELVSETMIIIDGKPLESMPITIHGKNSNNFVVMKSILQDVSDLNIDMFNRVVDQIEVLHLTALPTPFITGADPEDPNIPKTIGSSVLWILSEPDSNVGMIEFNGKSADAHRDYINDLKEAMAVSGAQILKQQGVSRETATSVLIRTSQETAIITDIVQNISSQITSLLKLYTDWYGRDSSETIYKLNSDFISVTMEPNAQIALVRSWLDGAISHNSVFDKMKEGEIVRSDKTFEEELVEINENPPPFFAKEKDAEMKMLTATVQSELDIKEAEETSSLDATDPNQNPDLKGSNLETGNEVKNPEATESV